MGPQQAQKVAALSPSGRMYMLAWLADEVSPDVWADALFAAQTFDAARTTRGDAPGST